MGGLVLRLFCIASIALVPACGSSGDDAPSGDGGETGDLLGTFRIQLVAPTADQAGYTSLLGKIYDGVQPETVIWEPAMTDGGCTLSTPRVPFCSTACGSTGACVEDDTCQAYPASQSVGTVTVRGVKTTTNATEVTLSAVSNSYQPPAGMQLAYPAFAEGDAISVSASGSAFAGAFTLNAKGVASLELANATSIALAAGTPLALSWTAPAGDSSRIAVKLDISHHGGSKGKIECEVDDTGSLAVSAALVDKLLALGAAGYPTIIVTREVRGHASIASGHADLIVSSEVEAPITVPGVTSCTEDTDCPAPMTCQADLTCK